MKKFDFNKIPTRVSFSTPKQVEKEKAVALAGGLFAVWVVWKLFFLSVAVVVLAVSQYKHSRGFREDVNGVKHKVSEKVQDAVDGVKDKVEEVKDSIER